MPDAIGLKPNPILFDLSDDEYLGAFAKATAFDALANPFRLLGFWIKTYAGRHDRISFSHRSVIGVFPVGVNLPTLVKEDDTIVLIELHAVDLDELPLHAVLVIELVGLGPFDVEAEV